MQHWPGGFDEPFEPGKPGRGRDGVRERSDQQAINEERRDGTIERNDITDHTDTIERGEDLSSHEERNIDIDDHHSYHSLKRHNPHAFRRHVREQAHARLYLKRHPWFFKGHYTIAPGDIRDPDATAEEKREESYRANEERQSVIEEKRHADYSNEQREQHDKREAENFNQEHDLVHEKREESHRSHELRNPWNLKNQNWIGTDINDKPGSKDKRGVGDGEIDAIRGDVVVRDSGGGEDTVHDHVIDQRSQGEGRDVDQRDGWERGLADEHDDSNGLERSVAGEYDNTDGLERSMADEEPHDQDNLQRSLEPHDGDALLQRNLEAHAINLPQRSLEAQTSNIPQRSLPIQDAQANESDEDNLERGILDLNQRDIFEPTTPVERDNDHQHERHLK